MTDPYDPVPSRGQLNEQLAHLRQNQAVLGGRLADLEQRLDSALRGSEQRAARLDAMEATVTDVTQATESFRDIASDHQKSASRLLDTVRMLKTRIEALEARPFPVPGEVVKLEATAPDDPCPICHDKDCDEGAGPRPPCPPDRPACHPPCHDCYRGEAVIYCGAECGNSVHMHRCMAAPDHEEWHVCGDCNYGWCDDPDPEPMVCEDCGAPATHEHPNGIRRMPRCAEHAGILCCVPLTPDPDPVPRWRQMVDGWNAQYAATGRPGGPLAAVLQLLSEAAVCDGSDVSDVAAHLLARIVAVAEREVGDGWQAEPVRGWTTQDSALGLAQSLISGSGGSLVAEDWRQLGCQAAAWLRDLTQDGAL